MPGRKYSSGNYRFGYQGSEKDPEISDGNYTTHFRVLDTRIGRWWSIDPKADNSEVISYSPYHVSYNCPIVFVDKEGDIPIPLIVIAGLKAAGYGAAIGGAIGGLVSAAYGGDIVRDALNGAIEGGIVGFSVGAASFNMTSAGIQGFLYYGGLSSTGFYTGFGASIVGQAVDREIYGGNPFYLDGAEAKRDAAITAVAVPVGEWIFTYSSTAIRESAKAKLKNPTNSQVVRDAKKQYFNQLKDKGKMKKGRGAYKRRYIAGAKEAIKTENRNNNIAVETWKIKMTKNAENITSVTIDGLTKGVDRVNDEELYRQEMKVKRGSRKGKVTSSQVFSGTPQK